MKATGKEKSGGVLNSFLTDRREKQKKPLPPIEQQKREKKNDIKIPVSESMDRAIRLNARNEGKTITEYCTYIMQSAMSWTVQGQFKEVPYKTSPYMVHVSLQDSYYSEVVRLSSQWHCTIREAAHRIFMTGAKVHEIL